MNDIIAKAEDIIKTYDSGKVKTYALRGVSLEIKRGAFYSIIGPSGHGKSTLMHILGGLDKPTKGKVFIDGEDTSRLSNKQMASLRARKIGFVFQFFNLLQNLTAQENIEVAMMFSNIPQKNHSKRAADLLALVGLREKAHARPSELSGGQQQRVAIARMLANDPEILFMDEPTGNLDSESEADVLDTIFKLHREGKTIVIVTHNNEIAKKAETVIKIKDGKIEEIQQIGQSSIF